MNTIPIPGLGVAQRAFARDAATPAASGYYVNHRDGARLVQLLAVVVDVALLVAVYLGFVVRFDLHLGDATRLPLWCFTLVATWFPVAWSLGAYERNVIAHPLQGPYVAMKATVVGIAIFHLTTGGWSDRFAHSRPGPAVERAGGAGAVAVGLLAACDTRGECGGHRGNWGRLGGPDAPGRH